MSDNGRPCFIVYGMPKPNTTRYTLRLPDDLRAAINDAAEQKRMTAAEVVRAAVEAYTAERR